MRIRPNRATLEAEVVAIRRCADGIGADIDVRVTATSVASARGGSTVDAVQAAAGEALTLFAAVPEALRCGARYRIEASRLGGPSGERIVLENAAELGDAGG